MVTFERNEGVCRMFSLTTNAIN